MMESKPLNAVKSSRSVSILTIGYVTVLMLFLLYNYTPLNFYANYFYMDGVESRMMALSIEDQLVVRDSIREFLMEELEKGHPGEENPWLNGTRDSTGARHVLQLEPSLQGMLKNVLDELRLLRSNENPPGTISNPNWETEQLDAAVPEFANFGRFFLWRLVVFRTYRTSKTEFAVIALSPVSIAVQKFLMQGPFMDHQTACIWRDPLQSGESRPRTRTGAMNLKFVMNTHGTAYDVIVASCTFQESVGSDGAGGSLHLNLENGRGSRVSEVVFVHREEMGEFNFSLVDPENFVPKHTYGFCSAPIWSNPSPDLLKQWLMYHHAIFNGDAHYFIYRTIDFDEQTMAVFNPLIAADVLTLIDFRKQKEYDTWYYAQDLALNDCLYRTRFVSNWTLFSDLDEYLFMVPPLTLDQLLEDNKDAPWIDFGSLYFQRELCAPYVGGNTTDDHEWTVERMLFRNEQASGGNMLIGEYGHRKYFANPRKVTVGGIHRALEWDKQFGKEIHLDASVARMNHYHGMMAEDSPTVNCRNIIDPQEFDDSNPVDGKFWKDETLKNLVVSSFKPRAEQYDFFRSLS